MGVVQLISPRNIQGWALQDLKQGVSISHVDAMTGAVRSSNQLIETYVGIGASPLVRETHGPRTTQDIRAFDWAVAVKLYDVGIRLRRLEMTVDKTDQVRKRITELTTRWLRHWDELMVTRMKQGESTVCYDGQFYYDTDHAEGASGTQSNDITSSASTTTAPTPAEVEVAIFAAITKMMSFKDDQGYPIHVDPKSFTIFTPLEFLRSMMAALNVALLPGLSGAQNVLATAGGYQFNLVPHPLLSSSIGGTAWTTKFAIHANDGRSFVRQELTGWEQSWEEKAAGSDYAFDNFGHEYSISGYRELAFGDWKSGVLVTFT